jgi:hypothetical protein
MLECTLARQSDCTSTYCAVHGENENHQEEREVSGPIVLREHEDEAADENERDRVDEEPEAITGPVTGQRMEKRPDHHEDVWWSCEQKVGHVVVVVESGLCERREEVLESEEQC